MTCVSPSPEVNAQEAFEYAGASGYHLAVFFMKRIQSSVITLVPAFCFCLCLKNKTKNITLELGGGGWLWWVGTRAAETFKRMSEIRNIGVCGMCLCGRSTTSHVCFSELKTSTAEIDWVSCFGGLCFCITLHTCEIVAGCWIDPRYVSIDRFFFFRYLQVCAAS